MRARDYDDGRLKSLDVGNLGDNDKGVKIQLQNVWFRYPTRDVSILNGLDMTVCRQNRAAICARVEHLADNQHPDREGPVCSCCRPIRYGNPCLRSIEAGG